MKAHRLAWAIQFGNVPDGKDVLHSCDNPPCVNWQHLFLGTQMDNMKDMKGKGRQAKGEGTGMAKLTAENVSKIRGLQGFEMTQQQIADVYGVSRGTIGMVLSGQAWQHLKEV